MIGSSKCDARVTGASAKAPMPVVISSSKCDFNLMADGLSVARSPSRTRVDLGDKIGSISVGSSKCDFKFQVDDYLDRFSLTARVAGSAKCDFSVLVDFGIRGGGVYRAAGGGASKCDFSLSRLEKVVNPDPTRK